MMGGEPHAGDRREGQDEHRRHPHCHQSPPYPLALGDRASAHRARDIDGDPLTLLMFDQLLLARIAVEELFDVHPAGQ